MEHFQSIHKNPAPSQKSKRHGVLPVPRASRSYVPITKSYRPSRILTRQNLLHPMQLRNIYNSTHNVKNRAARHLLAQHLMDKMLHVFDPSGKKVTIETLLKINPAI